MLTPEQSRLRICDNEIRALKRENTELRERLTAAKKGLVVVFRELASHVTWRAASEYRKLADDLEADTR